MRVYLASSFKLAADVERLYRRLLAAGHEVPDVWWRVDTKTDTWAVHLPDREWMAHPVPRAIAQRHWQSIADSDALVLVGAPEYSHRFTGANVEVGFAIGRGVPVLAIGCMERSAMYAPVIHADSEGQLLHLLDIIAVRERVPSPEPVVRA
jgi:hypothetical protein